MTRIGFLLNFPVEYKGGINYLKNLFYALKKYRKDETQILLFIPPNLDKENVSMFSAYAELIPAKLLQRGTFSWLISRSTEILLNFDPLVYLLLRKYKVEVISHSNYVYPGKKVISINWIPDFQHMHYPHLWAKKQLDNEKKLHRSWVKNSRRIIVSSHDAFKDLLTAHPDAGNKVRVVHFVSQPGERSNHSGSSLKYGEGHFFYVPNQFWEHKNHMVVFKAMKLLKDRQIGITVYLSGLMNDYRNKNRHIENLLEFVNDNGLTSHVQFLGLIPYADVLSLIHDSVAVINPSYFEGWSSTVEESKSMGKTIVLSDIPVHREQAPANGYYFNPDDPDALASILEKLWKGEMHGITHLTREQLKQDLERRTEQFASDYLAAINA